MLGQAGNPPPLHPSETRSDVRQDRERDAGVPSLTGPTTPEPPRQATPRVTPSSRVRFASFIDATAKRRQGFQELHLAGEAPEEERDAAPNVHRVLVTLNWRKHLPFDLAYVGSERLA